ncbi:Serine/threonine-protein kinase vrk, partial [Operophtera brumata]
MPRRGNEVMHLPLPPKKKTKTIEEPPAPSKPSLDASFCDDEALTPGIIFTDILQKKWRIGKPIGMIYTKPKGQLPDYNSPVVLHADRTSLEDFCRGSFGRIYLASDNVHQDVTKLSARYVIKIEPHTNGPLGSFTDETSGTKYRFLVLPRYDVDLHKVISRSWTKVLEVKNVLVLAIQILDVLEYLHSEGYTHSDIKSSNLMLGYDGSRIGKVPVVRLTPSFQKEIKDAVLTTKHRKPKPVKSRSSNYYVDEDFIAEDYNSDDEGERRLVTVKKKIRQILTDKDRAVHRHNAFNLRQLTSYVNYEDLNSSVCSDQSYQKLIDDFGNKNLIQTTKQFHESKVKSAREKHFIQTTKEFQDKFRVKSDSEQNEIYKEAVLSQSNGQIYLLDYGLASKFLDTEGKHKEFEEDARKAHDGTMEYSSRDSHIGAHSRRSDLETLGYNLLDWLTGTLPWKTTEVLAEPDLVHAIKKKYMSDLKLLLKTCFETEFYPQFMEKYLEYVTSLDFTEKPDYDYCRSLFRSELLKNGNKVELNFIEAPMSPINRNKLMYSKRFGRKNTPPKFLAVNGIKKSFERENVISLENDLKLELLRQTLNISSEGIRKPCASRNFFVSDADLVSRLKKSLIPHGVFGKKLSPKNLRSKQKQIKKRKSVRRHRNSIGKFGKFMDLNTTDAMDEVIAILKNKSSCKKEDTDIPEGYTPAMVKVLRVKQEREAREKLEALKSPPKTEAKRCTRSKRTIEPTTRVTRQKVGTDSAKEVELISRKNKTMKPKEPSSRVTRQKASIDSVKSELELVSTRDDDRTKSKSNRKNSKKVKIVEKPLPPTKTIK